MTHLRLVIYRIKYIIITVYDLYRAMFKYQPYFTFLRHYSYFYKKIWKDVNLIYKVYIY